MSTLQHIQDATGKGMLAVWTDGAGFRRLEAGRSLSGYSVFRYCGLRLMTHHHGMTLREAAGCIDRWLTEIAD